MYEAFSTSMPLGALVLLVASEVCIMYVTLLHEQLRNNFKVELRWLPLTESTQIFLCDSVCVSSNRKSKIENRKKKIENRKSKIVKKKKNRKKKLKRWTLVSHKVDPSPGGT